mmetsp:Transcript_30651/g.78271  ORF Transcript_30651/g.78271 Transcript_30651/m.78271 type:complete len:286 (+) Transcript_30651:691-1548(+)
MEVSSGLFTARSSACTSSRSEDSEPHDSSDTTGRSSSSSDMRMKAGMVAMSSSPPTPAPASSECMRLAGRERDGNGKEGARGAGLDAGGAAAGAGGVGMGPMGGSAAKGLRAACAGAAAELGVGLGLRAAISVVTVDQPEGTTAPAPPLLLLPAAEPGGEAALSHAGTAGTAGTAAAEVLLLLVLLPAAMRVRLLGRSSPLSAAAPGLRLVWQYLHAVLPCTMASLGTRCWRWVQRTPSVPCRSAWGAVPLPWHCGVCLINCWRNICMPHAPHCEKLQPVITSRL